MSLTALRAAFAHVENVPMGVPARLVLLALANHHNQETGRLDPSLRRLAKSTQLAERSVRLGLRELEKLKLIVTVERQQRTGRGKRNLTNRYRLSMGAQSAAGMGHNMPPKQEGYTTPKPSAFDDIAMILEREGGDA